MQATHNALAKEISMQLRSAGTLVLSAVLSLSLTSAAAFAQSSDSGAKRDIKSAGHETKDAAVDTGHGIKQGTKKGYHKTKHFTKKVGHKIEGKHDTSANNPQQ